jgi:hypothetical protein
VSEGKWTLFHTKWTGKWEGVEKDLPPKGFALFPWEFGGGQNGSFGLFVGPLNGWRRDERRKDDPH